MPKYPSYFSAILAITFLSCSGATHSQNYAVNHPGQSSQQSFKVTDNPEVLSVDPMFRANKITFDPVFAPYYAQLNDEEKQIYRDVFDAVVQLKPVVDLKNTQVANDSFYRIQQALLYDQPELFWFEALARIQHMVRYEGQSEKLLESVSYELNYNELASDLPSHQQAFSAEINKIAEQASHFSNPFEQELFVHDYLAEHLEYVTNSQFNQNAYSALINKKTVCAGFAKSFQLIMRRLNIPTYYISGYQVSSKRGSKYSPPTPNDLHAWNVVVINGKTYNVDVTSDSSKETGADGKDHPFSRYQFFNRTDKELDASGYYYNLNTSKEMEDIFISHNATSTDATFNKLITPDYLIQKLSKLYPVSSDMIVYTQEDFDQNNLNQLMRMEGLEFTVYSVIMNSKTYQKVSKYNWDARDKRFMNKIYQAKNIDGTDATNITIALSDEINLYISTYTFKKK